MADDASVKFAFGAVAGWIEAVAAAKPDLINHDVTLQHLAVIEQVYDQYRRDNETLRNMIREIKRGVDAAATL